MTGEKAQVQVTDLFWIFEPPPVTQKEKRHFAAIPNYGSRRAE